MANGSYWKGKSDPCHPHPVRASRAAVIGVALSALALLLLASPRPAQAHAQLESSIPRAGAVLRVSPSTVRLTFTERPAASAAVHVFDGCDQDVTGQVTREGRTVSIRVQSGRPGAWVVRYSLLSDTDGHASESEVGFSVTGSPTCGSARASSAGDASASALSEAGRHAASAPEQRPDRAPDRPSSLPVVVLALAGGALLAAALLARRALRGRSS